MNDVEKLRAALHLAVDLACDILARNARRKVSARAVPLVHDVNDIDQAFALRELAKRGWGPGRKAASR